MCFSERFGATCLVRLSYKMKRTCEIIAKMRVLQLSSINFSGALQVRFGSTKFSILNLASLGSQLSYNNEIVAPTPQIYITQYIPRLTNTEK